MDTQMLTKLIIFLSAVLFELGYVLAQQRFDNATDQQPLLVFKSHITNDPFSVLETWNSNTPFCNWTGVTCNMTKQRVTSLNLENLALSGTISPHIANLSFLSVLNLQNNTFYGIFPSELGQLFRLQFLVLNTNLIQGTIPPALGLCTRLVTLDLVQNRFQGTIPSELGSLSKLQVLGVSTNFLTGQIPASLSNLSSITNILLSENYLLGSIPEEFGHLPKLINLQIDQNNITGEIPSSLLNSSSLIMLSLTLNKLIGSLPSDMFSRLTNLTTLFLGGNNLTGTIPPSIANASILEKLDLSVNNFIGQVPLMGNMPRIQIMSLGDNQLTSEGEAGMAFITSLASSIRLEVFSLVSNRLTGKLPSSIGNLSRVLTQFVIGNNHLEGNLPAELGNLEGLTMLSLEYNSFHGDIPPSLGKLSILQMLFLHQNKFSGYIPQSLGNLSQLYEMSLSHNELSGTIPASLGNFKHLQVLDLSVNSLYGSVPKEIFELPSLNKVLNLSSNSLAGSVLVDVGKLKMVQGIDLSKNRFSGDIPASIGDCSNLLVLDLSGNSFQGSVPKSLAQLKGIEYIDLSRNNLSGRIPSSLRSLKFLQLLNLSGNHLEGEVPMGGIFSNATVVSLRGNPRLCGGELVLELPNCIVPKKHSGGSKRKIIVGLAVGLSVFGIFFILCVFFFWKRNAGSMGIDDVISFDGPHRLYTYYDLKNATCNFNSENLIGEGSFGSVYKGILRDGSLAAIKVFNMNQKGALKSFISECEALRNVRHRNLIQIMSACSNRDFKALVLQFMNNGNLEHWLYKNSWSELDTSRRLEIAIDVAFAMEYLHYDCETPVLHCDLKPSNVLLDENMTAHVADFGLARMILKKSKEGSISSTLGLKGSIGYIPPEYGAGGLVSVKGDVYSYGILILEMFTGRKPTDEMFKGDLNIQKWVFMALPDHIMDLVHHKFVEEDELLEICLVSVLKIGLSCAKTSAEDRPTMREVSCLLRSVKNQLSVQ